MTPAKAPPSVAAMEAARAAFAALDIGHQLGFKDRDEAILATFFDAARDAGREEAAKVCEARLPCLDMESEVGHWCAVEIKRAAAAIRAMETRT